MLSAAARNFEKFSAVSSYCVARETLFESVRVTCAAGPADGVAALSVEVSIAPPAVC